jgi:transcriptional regulator with XRE-family HTH domain
VFGQLVAGYRQERGLSQEDLADRTGLSVRAIRNLESGRTRVPRPASLRGACVRHPGRAWWRQPR